MMGHPADDQYASDCLRLWGSRQRYGGPTGYLRDVSYEPRIRGIPTEWHDDLTEKVGVVVNVCLDDEQRAIVKMYYEPQPDARKNGELRQCNMTLTLKRLEDIKLKVDRNKVNQAVDRAIGKVAMVLSLPSQLAEPSNNQGEEKKVCNF
jgi:hypothetical protein